MTEQISNDLHGNEIYKCLYNCKPNITDFTYISLK